ncbi:AlpA family phage regulatory protein [Aeromonas veronii]|uniref:AlpA family phage regulatory protein n=1 Tax=Aeromonas veronii TaxID=654 RepID=UPI0010127078|nr:AlpA family phage regulatory protein [Aeromonas veronii]
MNNTIKVLRIKDLMSKIGMARSTIYDRINPKSPRYDSSFPKRRCFPNQLKSHDFHSPR